MSSSESVCDRCGSQDLIEDEETGEIFCTSCGLVVSQINLVRPQYIEEEKTSTTNKTLSPFEQQKMGRLMAIDRHLRADTGDPYVIRVASNEIKRLSQTIHLPESLEEKSESIYRRAQKEGLILRGTIMGFAAASIYAACRVQGVPRTLRQISETSSEDIKDIARMYRILLSELNISVELDSPLKHLSRIAVEVGLPHKIEVLAAGILMEAMSVGYHTSKNPKGLAATALYLASKELGNSSTQRSLSDAAGISALTIRKHVKWILENVDLEKLVESIEE